MKKHYFLLFILPLILSSCSFSSHQNSYIEYEDLFFMEKGKSSEEIFELINMNTYSDLVNSSAKPHKKLKDIEIKSTDKVADVYVFNLYNGLFFEYVAITFLDDELYYAGKVYEYFRSDDLILNEAGEYAYNSIMDKK